MVYWWLEIYSPSDSMTLALVSLTVSLVSLDFCVWVFFNTITRFRWGRGTMRCSH
jgi:hypothetical protein